MSPPTEKTHVQKYDNRYRTFDVGVRMRAHTLNKTVESPGGLVRMSLLKEQKKTDIRERVRRARMKRERDV